MSMILILVAAMISLYALAKLAKRSATAKALVPVRIHRAENQRRR